MPGWGGHQHRGPDARCQAASGGDWFTGSLVDATAPGGRRGFRWANQIGDRRVPASNEAGFVGSCSCVGARAGLPRAADRGRRRRFHRPGRSRRSARRWPTTRGSSWSATRDGTSLLAEPGAGSGPGQVAGAGGTRTPRCRPGLHPPRRGPAARGPVGGIGGRKDGSGRPPRPGDRRGDGDRLGPATSTYHFGRCRRRPTTCRSARTRSRWSAGSAAGTRPSATRTRVRLRLRAAGQRLLFEPRIDPVALPPCSLPDLFRQYHLLPAREGRRRWLHPPRCSRATSRRRPSWPIWHSACCSTRAVRDGCC